MREILGRLKRSGATHQPYRTLLSESVGPHEIRDRASGKTVDRDSYLFDVI